MSKYWSKTQKSFIQR